MIISLETKCTTCLSLAAGAVCMSLNPIPYTVGLIIGVAAGRFEGTYADALPGVITTSLSLLTCALLISKISIPVISDLLPGLSALGLGFTLSIYSRLQEMYRNAQFKQDRRLLHQFGEMVL